MCAILAALVTGVHLPRRRSAEARRSTPFLALRGSNRPEFRSERISTTRVIHLRTKLGLGVLWAARAVVAAGLRAEGHWRARSHMFLGTRVVAKGRVLMRGA